MRGRRPLSNPLDRVVNVTVGLPQRDLLRLQEVCQKNKQNYRNILRNMVNAYLKRMEGVAEPPRDPCPYLEGQKCEAQEPPQRISSYILLFCHNREEWQVCPHLIRFRQLVEADVKIITERGS